MATASHYMTSALRPLIINDSGKDRRRRRRVALLPMYTSVVVRVLSKKAPPLEGHVVNLSETGLCVELDEQVKPGTAVAVEFTVSGLGRQHQESWPKIVAAAEVLRHDDVDDFPGGPYKTAIRFIRLPSIVQAEIARYVMANSETAKSPASC